MKYNPEKEEDYYSRCMDPLCGKSFDGHGSCPRCGNTSTEQYTH